MDIVVYVGQLKRLSSNEEPSHLNIKSFDLNLFATHIDNSNDHDDDNQAFPLDVSHFPINTSL